MRSFSTTHLTSGASAGAALLLSGLLIAGGATRGASAPPETSLQALEKAVAKARAGLPKSGVAYGDATRALIRQDPKRGATLIRESLSLLKKRRWKDPNVPYYLVDAPFGALLQKDFEIGMALALDHPERLLEHANGAFSQQMTTNPDAAERWARELIKRQPERGAQMVAGPITAQLYSLSALNDRQSGSQHHARDALRLFERFAPLLPPGPLRADVKMRAGLEVLIADRPRALKWLQEAVDENPGSRPELDEGLWQRGRVWYIAPKDPLSLAEWRKLAEQYKLLGSEAGVAGVARGLARTHPATALEFAPEIRDPSLRALAFSELLETRGDADTDDNVSQSRAAEEVARLLPGVNRPILRAFVAYRLAYWQRLTEPKLAAANFRLAYQLMLRNAKGPQGIFGTEHGLLESSEVLGLLLGHLSHYQPDEAMRLALPAREALDAQFPMVVFHAAAHAQDGRKAERWLRDYLPKEHRDIHRRAYGVCLTEEHPERAAALAAKMPEGHARDLFLIVVVSRLAPRDGDAALRLSRHFTNDKARSAAYLEATYAVKENGVDAMLQMAEWVPLTLSRADAMAFVVDTLLGQATADNLSRAKSVAESMPDEGPKWRVMGDIATSIGVTSPAVGMQYALGIKRYTERLQAERAILGGLIPMGMELALTLAAKEPSPEGRVDLIAGIADRLATSDPEAAVALAEKIEHRPTREEILASAIFQLQDKRLDRALELAPQVVTRSAASRALPPVWLRALESKKPPAKVWPLYRQLSIDTYGFSSVLRTEFARGGRDQDINWNQRVIDRTVDWMRGFPTAEWLGAMKPFLIGEANGGIKPAFVARLAATLADRTPDDALALANAASLDDYGWGSVARALGEKHPQHAVQAAERVRNPHSRVGVWLFLLEMAQARQATETVLLERIANDVKAVAAQVASDKRPYDRANGYITIARFLRRAGLDPQPYARKARTEITAIREPLLRADLLRILEEIEK